MQKKLNKMRKIKIFICRKCESTEKAYSYWVEKNKAKHFCKFCGRILNERKKTPKKTHLKPPQCKKKRLCRVCHIQLHFNNFSGLCRRHYIQKFWKNKRREEK